MGARCRSLPAVVVEVIACRVVGGLWVVLPALEVVLERRERGALRKEA